jgi:hypothetical protein
MRQPLIVTPLSSRRKAKKARKMALLLLHPFHGVMAPPR